MDKKDFGHHVLKISKLMKSKNDGLRKAQEGLREAIKYDDKIIKAFDELHNAIYQYLPNGQ